MYKSFLGFDYSMTCPAMCCIDDEYGVRAWAFINDWKGDDKIVTQMHDGRRAEFRIMSNVESYDEDIERYSKLADKILKIVWTFDKPVAYIEDYSMGSTGRVFGIAENTAILKHGLYTSNIDCHRVAPTTIKKYATGYGRNRDKNHPKGNKGEMHDQFVMDTGIDLQELLTPKRKKIGNPVSDLVDAYYIAKYCKEKELNNGKEKQG